ncbi:MAG: hypothetical protein Q9165_002120 [Trypethelium subeluteriae]
MPDYEKTLTTSKPYRRPSKLSSEEQLAADLEEFRREKEFIRQGEAGTFSGRDFQGRWTMGPEPDLPRDMIGDRARREELGITHLKPDVRSTIDHETGVVPKEQSSWPSMPDDKGKKKRKGWRARLGFKKWSLR